MALYFALLVFHEAKDASINIFHGLESDFKLCKPYFSSRLMKEMLDLYSRIQNDNFISHSEISNANKHEVHQTCVGESHCAALTDNHCPGISVPVDYRCIKAELFQHFVAETNTVWKNSTGNLTAKLFMEKMEFRRSENLINLPRVDLTHLTEIMSGHCRLNSHLYKIRRISDPSCPYCGETSESVTHFLCECQGIGKARKDVFRRNLLSPADLKRIEPQKLLRFINASGRLRA